MSAQRQYETINTCSIAGVIVGKINRWVLGDGRDGCAFYVETIVIRKNDEGKTKEDKDRVLCKAFGHQATLLKNAREGSKIMIPYGNIKGKTIKAGYNGSTEDKHEQFLRIVEWSFYGSNDAENKA